MQSAPVGTGMVTVNARRLEEHSDKVGEASTEAVPGFSGGEGRLSVGSAAAVAIAAAIVLVLIGWATWRLRNGKEPPSPKGRVSLLGVRSVSLPNMSNPYAQEPAKLYSVDVGGASLVYSEPYFVTWI